MQHEVVLMDRKMFIIAAVLSCCLIFSVVSAATTTPAGNATDATKVVKTTTTTAVTTGNATTAVKATKIQTVNVTPAAKVLVVPKVVSITPDSGSLGEKVAFNLTGSDFDKTAKVYLETEVKNKTKTIEATKNVVSSSSLITGNFKIPTGVPAGDWNVVVKQNGKESTSSVKFTIKE